MTQEKEIVIIITNTGDLLSLWIDDIDLREVGICNAWRASDIVWNTTTQMWDVVLPDKVCIGSWASREVAIQNEIKYLNDRL